MYKLKNSVIFVIVATCLACTSCVGLKKSQKSLLYDKSQCNKQAITKYTKLDLPKPFHELTLDTVLTNHFTKHSLNIANAIGVLDVLAKYIKLSNDYKLSPTSDKRIALIELSNQIERRINTASLEVSSIASELDCEEERANQFAYYLKEKESKKEKRLIISSIIVGAAGTIVGEIFSNNNYNNNLINGLTVGVSLTEATLGALILMNKKKIEFYHADNALIDVWNNNEVSTYFPPAIWYYLTYSHPAKNEKSLAKLLIDKWILFGQISSENNKKNNATKELFFGKGGEYDAGGLKNRADMLDQTEAYVTLMKQDLKSLMYEVEKLINNY